MGWRGGGWFRYMHGLEAKAKPNVTRRLLRRVLRYALPYRVQIAGLLGTIVFTTALGLLNPLIFREIIDSALPEKDLTKLSLLALGLMLIPIASGGVRIVQRKLNVAIGEGVIYDLRVALYHHLQQMSLRFFTNTKTGELMSRLNNDVVGAQNAISNTIVSIITNVITVIATLAVMLSLEWRLTILGVLVLPLFIVIARRLGARLQRIAREQMEHNAQMNAMMNETLNISGALLVKLFGHIDSEVAHFEERAADVRDTGIRRAVLGSQFFVLIGLVSVTGTALAYWVGGLLVIQGEFSIGDIVAFVAYLTQLYTPLQSLTNAPVDFAQSIVSFERVFEIIDLPLEIAEQPKAIHLENVKGALAFEDVTFRYSIDETQLLSDVERIGRFASVDATRSGRRRRRDNGSSAPALATQARELALEKPQLSNRARAARGSGRTERRRQNHLDLSNSAPLRSIAGRDQTRWPQPARPDSQHHGREHRHGDAGDLPLPRYDSDESALRQAGRDSGRARSRRESGAYPRLRHGLERWLRYDRRRARLPAERGRETAHGDRPRRPERPAHPRARRSHQPPRQPIRSPDPGRARPDHARTHEHRHRPSPEHDSGG